MADIPNDQLLRAMIRDPGWCLFSHRDQVKRMLPAMAESHVLILNIQKRLREQAENLDLEKLREEETGIT